MSLAWESLDHSERREVWDSFSEKFEFNPSIYVENFPSILEPTRSITLEISKDFGDEMKIADLEKKVLAGLRSQTLLDERIYALDWQHECYWFYPHREFTDWFVPALPNGDYYIFVNEGFSFGIFGHPWEWTSCVWGNGLISFFESEMPALWSGMKRTKL
jgi:hypothetical protein